MSTADDHADTLSSSALPPAPDTLAAILERISDGFLALDADWRITYINEKAAQVFGRRREDLTGKAVWEEFPEGVGTAFYEAYHEAARTQKPLQFEAFSSAHGRWFGCRVYPAPDGLSILFQDVTEQRETRRRLEENEQRYRSLFEQNVDAVFTFDLEGRFVEANPACETVSGYSPDELRRHPLPAPRGPRRPGPDARAVPGGPAGDAAARGDRHPPQERPARRAEHRQTPHRRGRGRRRCLRDRQGHHRPQAGRGRPARERDAGCARSPRPAPSP